MNERYEYEEPGSAVIGVVGRWLTKKGVPDKIAAQAMVQAADEAENRGEPWVDALQRVVNRNVRLRKQGWASFDGNWLELVRELR